MILPFLREIGRQSAAREIQLWDNRADTPDTGGGCRRMPDSGEGIAVLKEGLAQRGVCGHVPKGPLLDALRCSGSPRRQEAAYRYLRQSCLRFGCAVLFAGRTAAAPCRECWRHRCGYRITSSSGPLLGILSGQPVRLYNPGAVRPTRSSKVTPR